MSVPSRVIRIEDRTGLYENVWREVARAELGIVLSTSTGRAWWQREKLFYEAKLREFGDRLLAQRPPTTGCWLDQWRENIQVTTTHSTAIGKDIYNKFCFACHAAGVAGAPMVGDKEAWSILDAKGSELLLFFTIEGIPPGMPPMGLCTECTEEDLTAVIEYMVAASQ